MGKGSRVAFCHMNLGPGLGEVCPVRSQTQPEGYGEARMPTPLQKWMAIRQIPTGKLAALTGLTRQTIWRIGNGHCTPTLGTRRLLAIALEIRPDDLLPEPDSSTPPPAATPRLGCPSGARGEGQ